MVGSSASGLLGLAMMLLDHLGRDRLDIGRVGQLRIGHDRRRVGVHQDDAIALFLQRLARLRAGIIELAGLADDDRPGADDQDADLMSVRLGIGIYRARGRKRGGELLHLLMLDHVDEALEQVVAVLRAGAGFGMVLHREHRPVR